MNWENLTKKYLDKRARRLVAKVLGEDEEDEEFEMKPTADFEIDEKDYYKYWKGGF